MNEEAQARNVVGYNIFRVSRNWSDRISTRKGMSCYTTFPCVARQFSAKTEKIEQYRVTRLFNEDTMLHGNSSTDAGRSERFRATRHLQRDIDVLHDICHPSL